MFYIYNVYYSNFMSIYTLVFISNFLM